MSSAQFLFRNRHSNTWYGQVVVPQSLRSAFNGKRLIRQSLKTTDKRLAKRLALEFWVEWQKQFEWIKHNRHRGDADMRYIETTDVLGNKHVIDMKCGDAKAEIEAAQQIHQNIAKLIEQFKDDPETLKAVLGLHNRYYDDTDSNGKMNVGGNLTPDNAPESPIACNEAIEAYLTKLKTQGRKGKRLSPKTLLGYSGRLEFWGEVLGNKFAHDITLKDIADIQLWLTKLPTSYMKKGMSTLKAVECAQTGHHKHAVISDVTRADYLGQLKGFLEYAYASGHIKTDMARHVEIPNTKQSKVVHRLPFSNGDLAKIFNAESYGKDFYKKRGMINGDVKFWMPLLAVFSGARLEELAQLNTDDIKTCDETNIVYMDITDAGVTADGTKKQLKNKNSVRPIPIHSTLIDIGFMEYVTKRKSGNKDNALFDLKRDKQGRLGKGFSNWFSRLEKRKTGYTKGFIESRGVDSKGIYKTGEKWTKTFHSFRHTVIDNLRGGKLNSGEFIREEDIALVVGHTKNKTHAQTAEYGQDRSQLELRKAVIEAIGYEGVNVGEINWKPKNRR